MTNVGGDKGSYKLTEEAKNALYQALLAGASYREAAAAVKEQFGIELSAEAVRRHAHSEAFRRLWHEHWQRVQEELQREALAQRLGRARSILRKLKRLDEALDHPLSLREDKYDQRMGTYVRLLEQLRKELGQEPAQRVEHTGQVGVACVLVPVFGDNDLIREQADANQPGDRPEGSVRTA